MPSKEVMDGEKNRKNEKSKEKRHTKKTKEGKQNPAPSPPKVAAATASSHNDQQELTTDGTLNNATAPSSPLKRPLDYPGMI
jgi:hypothetical protein